MTERHYAHLAPNLVADTIRENFPRLTETKSPSVVPIGRARKNNNRTSDGCHLLSIRRPVLMPATRFSPIAADSRDGWEGSARLGRVAPKTEQEAEEQ